MLVLDSSGSMWGQIDGVSKIEIARDVVSKVLGSWNSQVDLGLMAYGHREKGNCSDIETLIEPTRVDSAEFSRAVGSLKPKGKTPLSQAVKDAAEALKFTENRATVILVSDGEETCGLAPCSIGESLEELGVDFTAHVISFDVGEDKLEGMRCLAERTGGHFLRGENASELQDAVDRAVRVASDQQEVDLTPAVVSVPDEVVAGAPFDVTWSGPKNPSDQLVIRKPLSDRRYGYSYVGDPDVLSPTRFSAPELPGVYEVNYETREEVILGKAQLTVIAARASVDAPDTPVVAGAQFYVEWSGPKNNLDFISVVRGPNDAKVGNETYIYQENARSPAALTAPEQPGQYTVVYRTQGKKVLARDRFTVVAPR